MQPVGVQFDDGALVAGQKRRMMRLVLVVSGPSVANAGAARCPGGGGSQFRPYLVIIGAGPPQSAAELNQRRVAAGRRPSPLLFALFAQPLGQLCPRLCAARIPSGAPGSLSPVTVKRPLRTPRAAAACR